MAGWQSGGASMMGADRHVIACTYLTYTSGCTRGALAYVSEATFGEIERICVLARSRSGRWICRWESLHLLGNFRLKTLPPEHPLYADERIGAHVEMRISEVGIDWLQGNSDL